MEEERWIFYTGLVYFNMIQYNILREIIYLPSYHILIQY